MSMIEDVAKMRRSAPLGIYRGSAEMRSAKKGGEKGEK